MFVISTDKRRSLLILKISGALTADDLKAFPAMKNAAIAEMGYPAGGHLGLVDLTEFPFQSQDVVAAIQKTAAEDPRPPARLALFTGGSAAGMQARRISKTGRCETGIFKTKAEAESWLFGR